MTAWRQASLSGGMKCMTLSASLSLTLSCREGTCPRHFSMYLEACSRQMNSERRRKWPPSAASAIFISVFCSLSTAEEIYTTLKSQRRRSVTVFQMGCDILTLSLESNHLSGLMLFESNSPCKNAHYLIFLPS